MSSAEVGGSGEDSGFRSGEDSGFPCEERGQPFEVKWSLFGHWSSLSNSDNPAQSSEKMEHTISSKRPRQESAPGNAEDMGVKNRKIHKKGNEKDEEKNTAGDKNIRSRKVRGKHEEKKGGSNTSKNKNEKEADKPRGEKEKEEDKERARAGANMGKEGEKERARAGGNVGKEEEEKEKETEKEAVKEKEAAKDSGGNMCTPPNQADWEAMAKHMEKSRNDSLAVMQDMLKGVGETVKCSLLEIVRPSSSGLLSESEQKELKLKRLEQKALEVDVMFKRVDLQKEELRIRMLQRDRNP